MDTSAKQQKFIAKIRFLLILILFFKIAGYFTISENIAVTRVLKILLRVSMTGAVYLVYTSVVRRGFIPSFENTNLMSPILYLLYFVLALASFLWSTDVGYSALQFVMNSESILFVIYFIRTVELINSQHEGSLRYSTFFAWSISIIVIIFLIGMYVNPDKFYRLTHGGEEARLGGYYMNPNELGMLTVVGFSSLLLEVRWPKGRVLLVLFMLASFYALFLTGSRSSMVGVLLVVFLHIKKSGFKKLKIFLYLGAFLSIPVIVQTIFIKQGDVEEVMSMTGRLPFWSALLNEGIVKEPWLGFGYMRIYYTDAFQSVHTYAGKMTHNTFIQVLMNLGFVGLFLVILQLAFTLRNYFVCKDEYRKFFFMGTFIPVIINSFTEFGAFGEANYGILFYQFLVFIFSIRFSNRLTLFNRIKSLRKTF